MKIKLMTLGALLSIVATGIAAPVRMPDAKTLHSRLKGLEHFIEKTDFVNKIADNDLEPLGVVIHIEASLFDYADYMKEVPIVEKLMNLMEMRKSEFFEACLQDHPEALKELKELDFYRPRKE